VKRFDLGVTTNFQLIVTAQRLTLSWTQAGYLSGKVKKTNEHSL
jgi:hypothetical protein